MRARERERERERVFFNVASPFKNRVVVTVKGIWSKRIIFRGDVLRIRSVHFKSTISSLPLLVVLESWESKSKQIVIVDGKQVVINVVVVVIVVVIVVVFFLSFLNSPIF